MMKDILFRNGTIYTGSGEIIRGDLLVRNGRIDAIVPEGDAGSWNALSLETQIVEAYGRKIVPGFIDIHTHGGFNVDVNAATPEELHTLGKFHASNGTTGWLCSILTDTREQTLAAIDSAKEAMADPVDGAELLGIHLEGPFLSYAYKGAMPPELLRDGDVGLYREYQDEAEGKVLYMTVAPEIPGAIDLIRAVSGEVVIAIGHSDADYETAVKAIRAGAKAATHTFNAMRPLEHHEPGILGAVLTEDIYCEAICDGRHLHPATVKLILACKGYDKVVAITDSIQAAGLPDGNYRLGINDVVVKDGDAKLAGTDTRAGSTLTSGQGMRNLLKFTGKPLEKILPLLTKNPAALLGIDDHKGSIDIGKDADIVILDDELGVVSTYVGGRLVYDASEGL